MGTLSYKRIIKGMLISGMCSVLLTSCKTNQAETSILDSTITNSIQTNLSDNSNSYSYYEAIDLIDSFMGEYIVLNSEENDIVRSQEPILDCSEEGGVLTSFCNDQILLRCQLIIYGAIGRVEHNYYVGDDFEYYTILNSMYESYPITKSKGEILYYTFDEYLIYEDEVYCIDRNSEQLILCNQSPISSIILENVKTKQIRW